LSATYLRPAATYLLHICDISATSRRHLGDISGQPSFVAALYELLAVAVLSVRRLWPR